jgi:hypothetical protein
MLCPMNRYQHEHHHAPTDDRGRNGSLHADRVAIFTGFLGILYAISTLFPEIEDPLRGVHYRLRRSVDRTPRNPALLAKIDGEFPVPASATIFDATTRLSIW